MSSMYSCHTLTAFTISPLPLLSPSLPPTLSLPLPPTRLGMQPVDCVEMREQQWLCFTYQFANVQSLITPQSLNRILIIKTRNCIRNKLIYVCFFPVNFTLRLYSHSLKRIVHPAKASAIMLNSSVVFLKSENIRDDKMPFWCPNITTCKMHRLRPRPPYPCVGLVVCAWGYWIDNSRLMLRSPRPALKRKGMSL